MTNTQTIKVGIIGTSFARAAYLPALRTIPDVDVVAVSSGKLANAQAVAAEFNIPHAYDEWRTMLDAHPFDLVGVVTPPVYHAEMVLKAVANGAHVICEKPTAMNADEARQMLEAAQAAGRVHMMGHELRFNLNRRKIKALIDSGAIGQVRHANVTNITPTWGNPASRPKGDWWSDAAMGGGRLGANGSHQFDLLRFWLGEIGALTGQVATMVPARTDKSTGEAWVATADDQVSFTCEMQNGAIASVFLSGVARHNMSNQVYIFGSEGTIKLTDADEKLWLARVDEDFKDVSEADPNASLPGIGKGIWNVSFVALMHEAIAAIREGRGVRWGATFWDGVQNQIAMDAVRQAWAERRWVTLG
jgi:predicted dehydrogenase